MEKSLFGRKRKHKAKSVSQSYKDSKGFFTKWKYWKNHKDESHYDPMYDFRVVKKPIKKNRKLWGKQKRLKEDEYEKGHDRVKRIINK